MIVRPGPVPNSVQTPQGKVMNFPNGWEVLPPGDAALTRRVKAAGDHWVIQEQKRGKMFSRGVCAPSETIARFRSELEQERSTEAYAKRLHSGAVRRNKAQAAYVEEFTGAVHQFLAFHPLHEAMAQQLARAVAEHATPVGSGTVARTKRISVEDRAEAAVIAWMRHQTTDYDFMTIARRKGERREVRRLLALRSRKLLEAYRQGAPLCEQCPLHRALQGK